MFLIGCLAIAGIPPFAGFFSKEEILLTVWADGRIGLFVVGIIAAFFTALYMFRLYFMVFSGETRSNKIKDVHESPIVMTGPMIVLAILAIVSGFTHTHWFGTFLGDWLTSGPAFDYGRTASGSLWIMFVTTFISVLGIAIAWFFYAKRRYNTQRLKEDSFGVYKLLYNKYYIDELYQVTVVKGLSYAGLVLKLIDRYVIEGIVNLFPAVVRVIGGTAAKAQNGQIQTYIASVLIGLVLLLFGFMVAGGYL